jgi:hypothetical protein
MHHALSCFIEHRPHHLIATAAALFFFIAADILAFVSAE